MKTLYEAANAIEAHMLVDVLKQEGIEAQIQGEALQGAMGEVPAMGLVRLLVSEESYTAARAIIERWERTEVTTTPKPQAAIRASGLRMVLVGLVIGAGATYAAYRAPVSTQGIDHDRDGVLDEKWTYSPNGMPLKTEVDRNLDHKVDYVAHHGARGGIDSAESDDNFDGVFESKQSYRKGNVEFIETDVDGDGYPDVRTQYVHGVMDNMEYLNPATGWPMRIEHYRLGVVLFADVDTDKDGTLDQRIKYSKLAEVVSRDPLPR